MKNVTSSIVGMLSRLEYSWYRWISDPVARPEHESPEVGHRERAA